MTSGPSKPQTTTHPSDITAELRNWYRVGRIVIGYVYGHRLKTIKDGTRYSTTIIKEVNDQGRWIIFTTSTHERFLCWLDQKNKEKDNVKL